MNKKIVFVIICIIIPLFYHVNGKSINNYAKKCINTIPLNSNQESDSLNNKELHKIHDLHDTLGNYLGSIYVKNLDSCIFKELVILKECDTLYKIHKNIFYSNNMIDITVYDDKCYEYEIHKIFKDYFYISSVCRKKKTTSELIQIEWDYDQKVFKVFRPPY